MELNHTITGDITAKDKDFISFVESLEKVHNENNVPFSFAIKGESRYFNSSILGCRDFYLGDFNPYIYLFSQIKNEITEYYFNEILKDRKKFLEFSYYRDFEEEILFSYNNMRHSKTVAGKEGKIKYIGFGNINPQKEELIYQIDVSLAYLTQAKILGFISQQTYDKLLNVIEENPANRKYIKKVFLYAVGSLAAITSFYEYSPKKKKYIIQGISKPDFYPIQRRIVSNVSILMQSIGKKIGRDFCFFWTDAIFTREGGRDKTKEMIENAGFSYKEEPYKMRIAYINGVKNIILKDEKNIEKSFNVPYIRTF